MRNATILITVPFLIFASFAGYILYTYNPAVTAMYPPCPFLYLTGLYCPGCGSLRAIHHLLHGNLLHSLAFNPLLLATIAFIPYLGYKVYRNQKVPADSTRSAARALSPQVYRVVLGIILIFWVLRNIPVIPLKFLAPGGFFS